MLDVSVHWSKISTTWLYIIVGVRILWRPCPSEGVWILWAPYQRGPGFYDPLTTRKSIQQEPPVLFESKFKG